MKKFICEACEQRISDSDSFCTHCGSEFSVLFSTSFNDSTATADKEVVNAARALLKEIYADEDFSENGPNSRMVSRACAAIQDYLSKNKKKTIKDAVKAVKSEMNDSARMYDLFGIKSKAQKEAERRRREQEKESRKKFYSSIKPKNARTAER